MKEKYGVDFDLEDIKVAYRETIKGSSDVQGKHKKQSGGRGQYGVFLAPRVTFSFYKLTKPSHPPNVFRTLHQPGENRIRRARRKTLY